MRPPEPYILVTDLAVRILYRLIELLPDILVTRKFLVVNLHAIETHLPVDGEED